MWLSILTENRMEECRRDVAEGHSDYASMAPGKRLSARHRPQSSGGPFAGRQKQKWSQTPFTALFQGGYKLIVLTHALRARTHPIRHGSPSPSGVALNCFALPQGRLACVARAIMLGDPSRLFGSLSIAQMLRHEWVLNLQRRMEAQGREHAFAKLESCHSA